MGEETHPKGIRWWRGGPATETRSRPSPSPYDLGTYLPSNPTQPTSNPSPWLTSTQVRSSPSPHLSPPPFSDQVLENVLENVLEFLTSKRDRNAASAVCRSWYRAEAQTQRELFIGNCYAVAPHRAIERFRSIKSVVLKGKPRFADFNLVPYGWGVNFQPWVKSSFLQLMMRSKV